MRGPSQSKGFKQHLAELKGKVSGLEEQLGDVRRRIHELAPATRAVRYAVVDRSRCTGCGLCGELCPVGAIRVTYVANIDAARCTGCGTCVQNCPQGAIHLAKAPATPAAESQNA